MSNFKDVIGKTIINFKFHINNYMSNFQNRGNRVEKQIY